MQATSAYRAARSLRTPRVASGTAASSGRSTIGASVPSTSSSTPAASGCSLSRAISLAASTTGGEYARMAQLILIGIAAGFFSALFGVGGGIVVVPLLLLSGRWQER